MDIFARLQFRITINYNINNKERKDNTIKINYDLTLSN